jgi:hypothetical protein
MPNQFYVFFYLNRIAMAFIHRAARQDEKITGSSALEMTTHFAQELRRTTALYGSP